MYRVLFQSLGLQVLFLRRAFAQVPDPVKDLVLIGRAQSVVVGNYFYTVGGYATFTVPDGFPLGGMSEGLTKVTASNGHLRRIDLTRPFTVTKIDTVQEQSIPLSTEVPRMRSGAMWARGTTICLASSDREVYPLLENGTWVNQGMASKLVWTYDTAKPDSGWSNVILQDSPEGAFEATTGGSVAWLDGIAYILGGSSNMNNLNTDWKNPNGTLRDPARQEPDSEVKFDSLFKLNVARQWARNETSPFGNVISGRMVSIGSIGEKGVLVNIGGVGSDGFNDMSIVQVYDIASSTWKTQKATSKGDDSPRPRKDFCAVAMSAQDHSSHQIYFYGGYPYASGSPYTSPLNDLWVLTLPSFQLIKVGNSLEAGRASGTCGVISPQYLLAYRGESSKGSDRISSLKNASLALLDLTDLEWKTEYTPPKNSTVYRVPRKVIEIIGGDETGNAATTTPIGGFNDKSLATIFNIADSRRHTSSSSASATSSPSARTSSILASPYTTPRNRMTIGVSIACAVAALLSISGITLLFRRRQRNKLLVLAAELGPKPWERREADGKMLTLIKYELEGRRSVAHEIGGGGEAGRGL